MLAATQTLQQAKKAYDERRYVEAKRLLEGIQGVISVQRQATDLLQKVNADYTKWQEEETKLAARKANEEARNAEIWIYDMQAPAGKTYRYRARVLLLNVFAYPDTDRLGELKDPKLGSQVALVGAWSAPSDPITLADSRHFFFTAGTPEKELASVDVFRFQQGRWFKDTLRNLAIGDSIGDVKSANTATGRIEVDYRTGYVVVDVGNDPTATIGSDKSAKIGIQKRSSAVLISMDGDGAIEPRWATIDKGCTLYKELDAKVKAAAESLASTATTGQPH
jgi:hypothetical protein